MERREPNIGLASCGAAACYIGADNRIVGPRAPGTEMFEFERLVVGYFVVLALVSFAAADRPPERWFALVLSILIGSAVVVASREASLDIRSWLPHLYLVAGYGSRHSSYHQ